MGRRVQCMCTVDPETLRLLDAYIGGRTNRSRVVEAAILEFLEKRDGKWPEGEVAVYGQSGRPIKDPAPTARMPPDEQIEKDVAPLRQFLREKAKRDALKPKRILKKPKPRKRTRPEEEWRGPSDEVPF